MKSKIWHIALSVIIACALWLYVISAVSPESEETFYDIPITYQNDILEERGLMIVSEKPTVTLRLKGNRSDLNELNADNITILVNLSAIQVPGTQMLDYKVNFPGNIPSNAIDVLSQSPNILQLKVENKIKKAIPIQLEYLGAVPEGYIADKDTPVMDVNSIEVSGPESVVSLIDHAAIEVDLSGHSESIIGEFAYVLCDAEGEPVDAQMVVTNVESVNLSVKIQRMKELSLILNLIEGGGATANETVIELSRETVWVSGSENRLRDLETLELGTVDLSQLQNETNTLEFDIVLPEGVTNMTGDSKVTATISFPNLSRKKLTVNKDAFRATGVPENATVNWIAQVLEIEVRGPKALVDKITEKDITVTMDFTDEELGSISKTPTIILGSEYVGVGTVSVPAITANLQEQPKEEVQNQQEKEVVPDGTEG